MWIIIRCVNNKSEKVYFILYFLVLFVLFLMANLFPRKMIKREQTNDAISV